MLLGVHWHDCRVARPAWAAAPSGGVSATWPAVAGVVGFPRVRGPLQVGPNTEKLELLITNCYYYYYYYYYYYTTTGVFLFFSSFSRLPLVTMGVRKGPHQDYYGCLIIVLEAKYSALILFLMRSTVLS